MRNLTRRRLPTVVVGVVVGVVAVGVVVGVVVLLVFWIVGGPAVLVAVLVTAPVAALEDVLCSTSTSAAGTPLRNAVMLSAHDVREASSGALAPASTCANCAKIWPRSSDSAAPVCDSFAFGSTECSFASAAKSAKICLN